MDKGFEFLFLGFDEFLLSFDDLVLFDREVKLVVNFVPFVDFALLPHLINLILGVFLHLALALLDGLLQEVVVENTFVLCGRPEKVLDYVWHLCFDNTFEQTVDDLFSLRPEGP